MHDFWHIPTKTGVAEVSYFKGTSTAAGNDWITWNKPRGKTMVSILLVGKGGNGGTGVIGAAGAGGGGGGSGGQTFLVMPLALLPNTLFLTLAGISATTSLASFIAVNMSKLTAGAGGPIANDALMIANGGGNGGNAATTTGGTAGTAAAAATAVTMPLGWQFAHTVLGGQAGTAGGAGTTTGTVGGALTLPLSGILVTGGTGGGAAPTTPGAGTAGGIITGAGQLPTITASTGGTAATVPPLNGSGGLLPIKNLMYGYGGQGGGGTFVVATTTGLVQSFGGNGAPGCGGGGMGGAYTGSSAGGVGMGGEAFALITCW